MSASESRSECITPWSSRGDRLEDKFWAALDFAFDDVRPVVSQEQSSDKIAEPSKPLLPNEIASGAYRNNHKTFDEPMSTNHTGRCDGEGDLPSKRWRGRRRGSGPLRLEVPSKIPAPIIIVTPITALPTTPLLPRATTDRWLLTTPGIRPPSTPALELVSNFLDSIVRLSDSRSSTPAGAVTISEDGEELIVESDVLIEVVEELNRRGLDSPVEIRREKGLRALRIPPPPITVPCGVGHSALSATVVNGPASCAQELDAFSWMSWERQLSCVQPSLWH